MEIIFQKVSGQPLSQLIHQPTSSTYSITDLFGNTITFDNNQQVVGVDEWEGDDFEQMVRITLG